MKTTPLLLAGFISLAVITSLLVPGARAAISVGPAGSGTLTFDTKPDVTEWATRFVPGGDTSVGTTAALNECVATNPAALIASPLLDCSPTNPLAMTLAAWTTAGSAYVQTRPNGGQCQLLMATLRNDTGATAYRMSINYALGYTGGAIEQLPSHRVYYSLTGLSNSWVRIPQFNNPDVAAGTTTNLSATVDLTGAWDASNLLYVVWADDNATNGMDGGYILDDVSFAASTDPVPLGVMLTSPEANQAVRAPAYVFVTALTSGSVPATRVSFYTNNVLFSTSTGPTYSNELVALPAGSYAIYAVATNATEAAFSATNTVTVTNLPLAVTLTSPSNNLARLAPAYVIVTAVTSGSGPATSVSFYTNNVLFSTSTGPSYSNELVGLPAGSYAIYAKATNATETAYSVTNTVTVTNIPLRVWLTSPACNTSLVALASIPVTATTSGTVPATRVSLYTNGVLFYTTTTAPYSNQLVALPRGSYAVCAVATNAAETAYSGTNTITVTSIPLTVTLTSPAASQSLRPPANVIVSAATGGTFPATRVSFYTNGVLFYTTTGAPYSNQLVALPAGSYAIFAVATNATETAYSATNTIVVSLYPLPWEAWSWRHPWPQGNDLYGVGGGGGKIVVVGRNGAKAVSADGGTNWQSVAHNTLTTRGVAYGAGMFVAVGDGATTNGATIQTSTDGFHWADHTVPSTHLFDLTDVAFGKGQFIVVGGSSVVLVSTNGMDWEERGTGLGYNLNRIKFDGTNFFGVGASVASSLDGRTWINFLYTTVSDITSANGLLVWSYPYTMSGVEYEYHVSAGTTQIGGALSTTLNVYTYSAAGKHKANVAFGNGRFVVAGADGQAVLFSSANGVAWTDHSAAASDLLYGLGFVEGHFVAVGNQGLILTSSDGETWSAVNSVSERNFRGITYGNGFHVAVGNEGLVMTSPDGVAWTYQSVPTTKNLRGVAYKNGLFVAVGEEDWIGPTTMGATMLVSSNGISWARIYPSSSTGLYDITVSTNLFLAVGGGGQVLTSSDGRSWSGQWLEYYSLNSIAWGGGLFVAVGDGGAIYTSPDGLHWTQRATGLWPDEFFQAVAYGNGMFVVMGQSGILVVSSDAVHWTLQGWPTSMDIEDVTFAQGQFVAVGEEGYVATSANGITWTEQTSYCEQNLRAVAYQDNRFIAVGNNETILQSGFMGLPVLRVRSALTSVGVELSLGAAPGCTYHIEASTNMHDWVELMLLSNEQETTVFVDTNAGGWSRRFYRVLGP